MVKRLLVLASWVLALFVLCPSTRAQEPGGLRTVPIADPSPSGSENSDWSQTDIFVGPPMVGKEALNDDAELINPPPIPLLPPEADPNKVDPNVVLDGRVRVAERPFGDYEWRYRVDNGSDEFVTSFYIIIPTQYFDSRITADAPREWVEQTVPGRGVLAGNWVFSFFSTTHGSRLRRGTWMEIGLHSIAHLYHGGPKAAVDLGTSPVTRLVFPWDPSFFPLKALLTNTDRKISVRTLDVPFPRLTAWPPPRKTESLQEAIKNRDVSVVIRGEGIHSGPIFRMTIHALHPVTVTLAAGSVLVPSLPQYDVMIIGRAERLMLQPRDFTFLTLRGYSISYGRRAPPPRIVLHHLVYHFPEDVPQHEIDLYQKIIERAENFRPALDTPLRGLYYDFVVQWALWRAQRLLEGNPLSVRDVERETSQVFFWRRALKGTFRVYLMPLQIYDIARRIWTDTDDLLYAQHGPEPIP